MSRVTEDDVDSETIHDRVAELEDQIDTHELIDPLEMAAIRRTLTALAGYEDADPAEIPDEMQLAIETAERFSELHQRLDELEADVQRLSARDEAVSTKDEKVAEIVTYAQRRRDGEAVVKLRAKEIKGAAGCSRRYAYDLIDDLPEQFDWALAKQDMRQYGDLEIDSTDDSRRLGIDFAGVHSAGVDVNKFTTQSATKGPEE